MKLKNIILLIILILLVIFGIGNRNDMELWFFGKFNLPKIVVILVSLIIGFFAGIFLRNIRREEKEKLAKEPGQEEVKKTKKPKKKIQQMEKESKKEE